MSRITYQLHDVDGNELKRKKNTQQQWKKSAGGGGNYKFKPSIDN